MTKMSNITMIKTLQIIKASKSHRQPLRLVAVLTGILTLAACASTPLAPTGSLQAAEQAITTAENARVADHASLELSQARDKLAAAHAAVQRKEMVRAEWLADEAFVSAQLATAKAGEINARAVNKNIETGTKTLETEMNRNTRSQQNTGLQQ